VVRDLAREVADRAADPAEAEKVRLWTLCNDLHPVRPMVFLDPQNGWPELDAAWLRLECEDPFLRPVEHALRRRLLRAEHLPDDGPLLAEFPVRAVITGAGYDDYGIPISVEKMSSGGAYRILSLVNNASDRARLHPRPVRVDHEATRRALDQAQDAIGDILPVTLRGKTDWRFGLTRVLVHWRGLGRLMLDLYDEPGLLHDLMSLLRDDFLREIDLMEAEGTAGPNAAPDNVTGSGGLSPTTSLPAAGACSRRSARDCICWGESQETVGVGPAHFEQFVLAYQLPLFERFGLVDYGCCEPLDSRLDLLLARIPNLRWVSVSPWADKHLCAEKLGGRYVYVFKPNPAFLCAPHPAWDAVGEDIASALAAAHGQPMHIVMKDTSTFHGDAGRATEWCLRARRLAEEAA
jgi:hypothetical protein